MKNLISKQMIMDIKEIKQKVDSQGFYQLKGSDTV